MASGRSLRVLPSNAPNLAEHNAIHRSPLGGSSVGALAQTCPQFNSGRDCRVCDLLHACSTCLQDDHDAQSCKEGILQNSSGNIGSIDNTINNYKNEPGQQPFNASHTAKVQDYLTRNAVKLESRKRRRGLDPLRDLPLFYRSELQSPRYIAYRVKSRSKGPNQVWPDDIEEAFQEALRLYPSQGRKKLPLNGKQAGSNEFITAHIEKRTGVIRTRKQVSSHIQTLKGYMSDNEPWMSLVIANGWEVREDEKEYVRTRHTESASRLRNTSRISHFTHSTRVHDLRALPPSDHCVNQRQHSIIRRVNFSMILYKGGQKDIVRSRPEDKIHTYTSIQCMIPAATQSLENLHRWRDYYPLLAQYCDQDQISCPIYLFDTNLDLMEDPPKCLASLTTHCSLEVTHGINYNNWHSFTKFYQEEGKPVDLAKFYKLSSDEEPWADLGACRGTKKGDITLHGLPLKSLWWATKFSNMISRVNAARSAQDTQAVSEQEEYIERYLKGVSAMQEIYASPHSSNPAERIAILIWKFRKARKGEVATTTWRPLNPPVSSFHVQSPTPPPEQPPMTLDTRLRSSSVDQSGIAYTDFHDLQQPSIFAANAEELLEAPLSGGSSSITTPPSDYASFPSSTSTSFPSNISNSSYQQYMMQESSFRSQDSIYPSLGSFNSQESQYHSQQELITNSHDIYDSKEGLYHYQQDTVYHQASSQIYDFPTPQTLYADDPTAAGSQDFTGDQIHLSYPQDQQDHFRNQPSVYEPHLFAPRAQMTPQHQLIQHPEQFEPQDYDLEPADLAAAAALAGDNGVVVPVDNHDCNIDWQLIDSQSIPGIDMRFPEVEGEGEVAEGAVQQFEEWRDEIIGREEAVMGSQEIVDVDGHRQGHILGEVAKEGPGLEEYR